MKKLFLYLFLCSFWVYQCQAQNVSKEDKLLGELTPERICYDAKHYALKLRVEPDKQFIKGSNTIKYQVNQDSKVFQIDLHPNLKIKAIKQGKTSLKFKREERAVFVSFKKIQKKGTSGEITIFYEGNPVVAKNAPWDGGFVWKKDAQGRPWVGVACQGAGASMWYPNKDHWSDKPDSVSVALEVPSSLMAVSNGNLKNTEKLNDNFTRYTWATSYPINNYNLTLNIAAYKHFSDVYTSTDGSKLDLDYYVLEANENLARKQFEQVKPMLACYEKLFGKYPFWNDGYALVETPYLGMEHQGAIAYGNKYKQGYAGSDLTGTGIGLMFDFIIIHETGHEYWGNSVSADDKADMWIHEAFCTYGEALYVECLYGKEKAYTYSNGWKKIVSNDKPIVSTRYTNTEGSGDMYFKGALMLHTIRNIVDNDEKWLGIIKSFAQDFKGKVTQTDEVIKYFNTKTGRDLTSVFEQYLKTTKIPTFEYKIEEGKFKYRFDNVVEKFTMPVVVEFGATKMRLEASTQWETVVFDVRGGNDKLLSEPIKVRTDLFYINVKK
ncbi:MAG: M1 family metallopeptidase [Raineya sp.]|nr:M1 family metallopeptidase [Raineya sp.]